MMYFLVRPDGKQVPVIVTGQDKVSIKISNFDGDERWIRYTDFFIKENLIIMKKMLYRV